MNKALRNAIKALFITKYLDELGIKMPEIPQVPKFDPPPMPDLAGMLNSLPSASDLASAYASIFTDEYIKAMGDYRQGVEDAGKEYASLSEMLSGAEDTSKKIKREKDGDERKKLERSLEQSLPTLGDAVKRAYGADIDTNERNYTLYRETIEVGYKGKVRELGAKFKSFDGQKYKVFRSEDDKSEAEEASDKAAEARKAYRDAALRELKNNAIVKQYNDYIERQTEIIARTVLQSKQLYEDTKKLFTECPKNIRAYFTDANAPGSQKVERLCDDIDETWDNAVETVKELGVDLTTLFAKIAMPGDVVVGAAVGVPNPGYKISVFMENFKKVVTDITKLVNYIKMIIKVAKELGFDMNSIPAFAAMMKMIEALQGSMDDQFRKSVKRMRKRTKWMLEIDKTIDSDDEDGNGNTDGEEPDDEPEYVTRKAGYKYAVLDVDYENYEVKLLGYRCYCTKNKTGRSGKTAWRLNQVRFAETGRSDSDSEFGSWYDSSDNAIRKNGGPLTDKNGKHYYYIPADDEESLYGSAADAFSDDKVDANGGGDGLLHINGDENGVRLQLGDGRIVTIDYQAEVGDVIRLNDGTVIRVDE